jgi:CheY-specific phosphatase CheX
MNQTTIPVDSVDPEAVHDVVNAIWTAMLELGVEAVPANTAASTGDAVVGTVSIRGGWNGWVEVTGTGRLAGLASSAMLQAPLDELEPGDIWDGWAELTNMIGGSIKALLPEPSVLSLPTVTNGSALRPGGPSGLATHFESAGEPLTVRVVASNGDSREQS